MLFVNMCSNLWCECSACNFHVDLFTTQIKYDVDNCEDSMYLLVAFTHFDKELPARGERPLVLPDMDQVGAHVAGRPSHEVCRKSISL